MVLLHAQSSNHPSGQRNSHAIKIDTHDPAAHALSGNPPNEEGRTLSARTHAGWTFHAQPKHPTALQARPAARRRINRPLERQSPCSEAQAHPCQTHHPTTHTQALRPGGEHTEHRLRPEAPLHPTVRPHAHRGHARHNGRMATARARAAWKTLTREKAAQRVTVPIDRRTAAHRAKPIQAGGGSVPFRCHGRTRRATDTTAMDRIDATTRSAHTTGVRVAA